MIAYFDTSSLVPLFVEEAGSGRASLLWDQADHVAGVRLLYAECRAALAMATRLGRLSTRALRTAVIDLEVLYQQIDIVEVSDDLVRRAGTLSEIHSLRGYDAVHLAAGETFIGQDVVFVAGDGPLYEAAKSMGLAVART
ncbi:MAG: type II toxin-antitoxin system VapC family toxin [Ferrimicrobium sp.]